jgi:hypothetical protein
MKTIIISQARYGSSRFPGKVLQPVGGKALLEVHLERLNQVKQADRVVVATTHENEASEIVRIAESLGCSAYRGSIHDVLDRFYQAARVEKPEVVIRVTSDCPLIDPVVIDEMISQFSASDLDYLSNVHPPTFPDGLDIEIFTFQVLEKAWRNALQSKEREHVTPYIYGNPGQFRLGNFRNEKDYSEFRLTVDYPDDISLVNRLVERLGDRRGWLEYVECLEAHSELFDLNHHRIRNKGY